MRKWRTILIAMLIIAFSTTFSFAAADPAVTLVSPPKDEPIVTNNLLISIKVTQPGKTLRINAYELKQKSGEDWVAVRLSDLEDLDKKKDDETKLESLLDEAATFKSKGSVSFYTKKLEDITPGVYHIKIDTLDASGKEVYSSSYQVLVKEMTEDEEKIFDTPKSGVSQFLQNVLSKIFKS